jgi:DNA-3-methyladenine glycosylase II
MIIKNPYQHIIKKDKDLVSIYKRFGAPPDWQREPGFATLVHIILEQQVSLASAKAAFDKLARHKKVTPKNFLTLDDAMLKTFGFSRQKIRYSRALAQAIVAGEVRLEHLHTQDDATIRSELIKLPGIGHWTIDIYLLMALNRPDVLPVGDLALRIAVKERTAYTRRTCFTCRTLATLSLLCNKITVALLFIAQIEIKSYHISASGFIPLS